MKTIKRFVCVLMAVVILTTSVSFSYPKEVKGAEWIAGTIATIGGGPMLTALLVGGLVVAGGITLQELMQSDPQDFRNFTDGVKNSYMEYVKQMEYNQRIIDQGYTDQSLALQEAQAEATKTANDFWDACINQVTTTKNATYKAVKYWEEFCEESGKAIDSSSDSPNEDITDTTEITVNVNNLSSYSAISNTAMHSIGSSTVMAGDHRFIVDGQIPVNMNNSGVDISSFNRTNINVPTDRYRVYYVIFSAGTNPTGDLIVHEHFCYVDLNRLTGNRIASYWDYYSTILTWDNHNMTDILNRCISYTNFPVFVVNGAENSFVDNDNARNLHNSIRNNVNDYLPINGNGNGTSNIDDYLKLLLAVMASTKAGHAISTGRKQLVNEGDEVTGIFKDNSIPTKKSGTTTSGGTVSGEVGWDIPASETWDDCLTGTKPYSDVVAGTNAVGVPSDEVTGVRDKDRVIEYPDTAKVQDTRDYPREEDPEAEGEIPEKTYPEIEDENGGPYYPAAIDLTTLFPFCIPFDIAYCIEKFTSGNGEPPIIHIPIVYPNALQGVLGESYDVVIDFSEYTVLRNVIKTFILIFFLIGLMQITRNLIRG